jgi:D-alanyl-D-alanine carboxypeptidase/D-alanyl-D-alanine-endopeptidase (penicillin-binding protein 4)
MPWVRSSRAVFAVTGAMLAAPAGGAAAITPQQALRKALNRQIAAAGSKSGAVVLDLQTGELLYSFKGSVARLPASIEKLYTTSTALLRFGTPATLSTAILGDGYQDSAGVWHGTLYLKGGGDPTFGSASFDRARYGGRGATIQRLVANLVRGTGIRAIQGGLAADGSYFDGRRGTPATGYRVSFEVEGQLDGVAFDRGFVGGSFQLHPTLFAAQQLAPALRAAHVSVPTGTHVSTGTPPASASQLATVNSPSMVRLIQLTNTPSDNYLAETLLKDLGARFGGGGTTLAGANVVRSEMASAFGIAPRLNDGSGLSYYDSTSPVQVVTLLQHMASNTAFVNSLAIAGQTGTLAGVDRRTIAQGRCHGKTGTLAAVANVAGYCQAKDGHTLAFAFLVNGNGNTGYVHDVVEAKMMLALARYNG